MANVAKTFLMDKDIRELPILNKRYYKVVGNPKELVIFINPKGTKIFNLRLRENNKERFIQLKEFRVGIYSVAEARKDATTMLKELNNKDIETLIDKESKYLFKNLFNAYIEQKYKKGLKPTYLEKVKQTFNKYLLPNLANRDVKDIKYSDCLTLLNAIFNPNNPKTSRLETIHRLINHLKNIFLIPLKDRYIDYNPAFGLESEFPTIYQFSKNHNLDNRLPALTQEKELKEFIIDLKSDNKIDLQTKRALYLLILTANRPINVASAKWSDIDLNLKIWTIKAKDMKTKNEHIVALSSYACSILEQQKLFSDGVNGYVFPSFNQQGHIHRDTLSKAIRNLKTKCKYQNKATSHGFRATFRTLCTLNKAELLGLGISENTIENVLAHKETNKVKYAYERETATLEQKRKLLQWYGDYLNHIENLGINNQ